MRSVWTSFVIDRPRGRPLPGEGLEIVFMIEAQVRYVLQCLSWLEQGRLREVEVRPDVQQAYNVTSPARFAGTVWRQTPGKPGQRPCRSWSAPGGKNIALWPGLGIRSWWANGRAEIADYTPVPKTRTQSAMSAGTSTSMANEAGNNLR